MYYEKHISLVAKEDFITAKLPALTFIEDGGTLTDNQIAWDSTKKCVWLRKDAATAGYFLVDLGFLEVGDIVKVTADVFNKNGVTSKISLNRYTSATGYTSVDFADSTAVLNTWETVDFYGVIKVDMLHKLHIGVAGGSSATEFGLRNVQIRTMKKRVDDKKYRTAMLRVNNGVFAIKSDVPYDTCTITHTAESIKVKFDRPLPDKSIAFVSNDYYPSGNKYDVKAAYSNESEVSIVFYLAGTNTPVQLSQIDNYNTVSILLLNA